MQRKKRRRSGTATVSAELRLAYPRKPRFLDPIESATHTSAHHSAAMLPKRARDRAHLSGRRAHDRLTRYTRRSNPRRFLDPPQPLTDEARPLCLSFAPGAAKNPRTMAVPGEFGTQ